MSGTKTALGLLGLDFMPGAASSSYQANVLALNPIAYWPLNETSGTNADNAEGTAARDGTYSGVSLNNAASPITGDNAGLWDKTNDYCDIYSASLEGALDWTEGTVAGWMKVTAAGTWSDSTNRRGFFLYVNANNFLTILKSNAASTLTFSHRISGTAKSVNHTSTETAWFHFALTWSKTADQVKAYIDGAQTGSTQTGLGADPGALTLDSDRCAIGADTIASPSLVWDGWLSHMAVFDSALSAANITTLATAV